MKKDLVALTAADRQARGQLTRSGTAAVRNLTRARMLLKAEEGLSDAESADEGGPSVPPVERPRHRFVEENLRALTERPRPGQRPKLDAQGQAHLIAVAWSKAPGERKRWTLRLLADTAVEFGRCEQLSAETVRWLLKSTPLSPGRTSHGAFPR
jgi:hypothetical protein